MQRILESYSPEQVEAETGIPAGSVAEAARLYAKARNGVILISTGQNSGRQDRALAQAAGNLALITGKIGRENSGIFILGEKNNSQGALDMGVAPGLLPGYADLKDPAERSRFEKTWKLTLPEQAGLGALAILQAIEEGKSLVIFPEGGILTKHAPNMIKFKDGAFRVAIEKQIPDCARHHSK